MEKKLERLKRQTRRPATPGAILEDLLPDAGLTQGQLAQRLGVSRQTVNEIISGKRSLTPDMAHRLGRLFGNGPALWLNLQKSVELWDALHMDQSPYEQIEPLTRVA